MAELLAQNPKGTVVTDQLESNILKENLIGLQTTRVIKVYLPPGYADSKKRYPVVYYLHNIYSNPENELENFGITSLLNQAFVNDQQRAFILVAGDFTGPTTGSWYENSPTSGYWLDYIIEELLPYVENKYRVIKKRESRAVIGHYVGGRGALKLAMTHAETFALVYAMHPVATGTGYEPMTIVDVDWNRIHAAKTYAELQNLGRTTVYVPICQAFLPNPDRPPFYCDFIFEKDSVGDVRLHGLHNRKYQQAFLLDETLDVYAANLKRMHAIAYDWARFDPTQAHVISCRRFSKLLTEHGIEHEGEEYAGDPWSKYANEYGRFNTRVLPFLFRYLAYEK